MSIQPSASISYPAVIPTEIPGLQRDRNSGAIINTNISEYQTILAKREQQKEVNKMRDDLATIKTELEEIRGLMSEVLIGLRAKCQGT